MGVIMEKRQFENQQTMEQALFKKPDNFDDNFVQNLRGYRRYVVKNNLIGLESLNALSKLTSRIELCSSMPFASLVCGNCAFLVKYNCTKMSCLCPYCDERECITNRKRLGVAYLQSLGVSPKTKSLIHTVFGFPRVKRFSKSIRASHMKAFNELGKIMIKLGTPLHMALGRDLNGSRGDLYVHYHSFNLPVKDWRFFRANLFRAREMIIEKFGIQFSIKFKHYRNKKSMFGYLAKRVAGVFQNDGDKESEAFGYSRLMSLKEYYEDFYKVRKFKLIGLRRGEAPSVLALLLDNFPKLCPNCQSSDLKVVKNEDLGLDFIGGPPPPLPKHEILKIELTCI